VREEVALAAALYVVAYVLAQARRRRRPGRVVVLAPLRAAAVPQEIVERLGAPSPESDLAPFLRAEFTVAFQSDAPGISLGAITDESSLEKAIGPFLRRPIFVPGRDHWQALLARRSFTPGLLFDLALEVLHRIRPRSLLVDLRPPERAREPGISTAETDLDLGMYGYEIRCRLRRYSRYRETPFDLLFCDREGKALRVSG
jgi:hypothetical protein